MKAVHSLGYVCVFYNEKVYVYTEEEFLAECYFFDPSIDEETWAKKYQLEPDVTSNITPWTEQDWIEWRKEREGILIYDAGYTEEDAVTYTKTLEALERFRVRIGG